MPLIFQEKQTMQQVLAGFECDRCKRQFDTDNTIAMDEMLHWRNTGGYGSVWGDGVTVDVVLCQECAHDLFAAFARIEEHPGHG